MGRNKAEILVRVALGGDDFLPPKLPAGLKINHPKSGWVEEEAENLSEVSGDDLPGEITGSAFLMRYVNAKKEESTRRVKINSVNRTANGDIVLHAFCYESDMSKTFRVDRAIDLVNLRTGEFFADPLEWLRKFYCPTVSSIFS